MSLLFAVGTRPSADDIVRLLATPAPVGPVARLSHRPPDDDSWLELLASGLTFDIVGLAPAPAAPAPPVGHVYGLPDDVGKFAFEAVSLALGPHIGAGAAMLPVTRVLVGLAADLAQQLPVTAVCWNPAQSWMEPKYFVRRIAAWLSGSPFPVLGLTGLTRRIDGTVESSGLAFFTGQEVLVRASEGEDAPVTIKLAGCVIDHLVQRGRLERSEEITVPRAEEVTVTPSHDGKFVEVLRNA